MGKNQQDLLVEELHQKNKQLYLFKGISVSLICNILILLFVYIMYLYPLEPKFFSTSFNGSAQALTPIYEPNTSDLSMIKWASLATVAAYSFDFVNYNNQLTLASQYFTSNAWNAFYNALNSSNNLDEVISKKLIVNAVVMQPPVILAKGNLNGVFSWRIQIPLLVTYQSAQGFVSNSLIINLLVTRISTLESIKGIGIAQFTSEPYHQIAGSSI